MLEIENSRNSKVPQIRKFISHFTLRRFQLQPVIYQEQKNIFFFGKLQFLLKTSVETNLVGNQFKSNLLINTKMNYLHKKTFPIYMFQNIPWGKLHEKFAISRQKKTTKFCISTRKLHFKHFPKQQKLFTFLWNCLEVNSKICISEISYACVKQFSPPKKIRKWICIQMECRKIFVEKCINLLCFGKTF